MYVVQNRSFGGAAQLIDCVILRKYVVVLPVNCIQSLVRCVPER